MNKESISDVVKKNLNKRYKREARFKRIGQFSIFVRMPDGMMCLLGSGGKFAPYTGPSLQDLGKK